MKRHLLLALAALLLPGCAMQQTDYALFNRLKPRSILIFSPLNDTASVDAPEKFLPTITIPVAERGYYVIPVMVSDRMFKENGVIGAAEMRQVPRDKLREIFGADAVLDVTINDWGTTYLVFNSQTTVKVTYRLLDLHTGQEIWNDTKSISQGSDNNNDLVGALVGALAHAVEGATSDLEIGMSAQLNNQTLLSDSSGLLAGSRWVEKP